MSAVAIVRGIPDSFEHALSAAPPPEPIDVARAKQQHAAYVAALRRLGARVIELPADPALPDCCFVEDTAVVALGIALIARPGAPSRRAETAAVRAALAELVAIEDMAEPATLDGGDCMRLGKRLYIGRSSRTNPAGIARAAAVFARVGIEVVEVAVEGALHLKSVCSPLGDDTVLVARGALAVPTFPGARVIELPAEEADAANAVTVGRGAVIAAGCPVAAEAIRTAGYRIEAVDTSEMRKADGALTCLSIVV